MIPSLAMIQKHPCCHRARYRRDKSLEFVVIYPNGFLERNNIYPVVRGGKTRLRLWRSRAKVEAWKKLEAMRTWESKKSEDEKLSKLGIKIGIRL